MRDPSAAEGLRLRLARLDPQQRERLLALLREGAAPAADAADGPDGSGGDDVLHPLTGIQRELVEARGRPRDLASVGTRLLVRYELDDPPADLAARLDGAVRQLLERHDALSITIHDGRQRLLDRVPVYHVEVVDLGQDSADGAEARVRREQDRMRDDPTRQDRWPLFEFTAYRLPDRRVVLLGRIDKCLVDGFSRMMLDRDLSHLLSVPDGRLPPLTCSYRDYLVARAGAGWEARSARAERYWLDRIAELPRPVDLPLRSFDGHPVPSRVLIVLLDPEAWARIRERASALRLTPSLVVIAAFADVLARWSGRSHFLLPLLSMYRPPVHPGMGRVVGNFTGVVPLEVAARGATFARRARDLRARLLRDLVHQDFSGYEVLRGLAARDGTRHEEALALAFNTTLEYRHLYRSTGVYRVVGNAFRLTEDNVHPFDVPGMLLGPTITEGRDRTLRCRYHVVEEAFRPGFVAELLGAYADHLQHLAGDEAEWADA
jgi:nonribosomal peptide synthetase protein BlmIV